MIDLSKLSALDHYTVRLNAALEVNKKFPIERHDDKIKILEEILKDVNSRRGANLGSNINNISMMLGPYTSFFMEQAVTACINDTLLKIKNRYQVDQSQLSSNFQVFKDFLSYIDTVSSPNTNDNTNKEFIDYSGIADVMHAWHDTFGEKVVPSGVACMKYFEYIGKMTQEIGAEYVMKAVLKNSTFNRESYTGNTNVKPENDYIIQSVKQYALKLKKESTGESKYHPGVYSLQKLIDTKIN